MSPCLFNLYAEYIMPHARLDETQAGVRMGTIKDGNGMDLTEDIKNKR